MWSVHAEGRAVDLGIVRGGVQLGDELVFDLLAVGDLVLQRVIFNRRIFDLVSPEGRAYTGVNPHTDHVHVELSWAAARREIDIAWPSDTSDEEDPMPILIVAYRGAQWAVAPDLTSRVGLSQGTDVQALLAVNSGRTYVPSTLSEALMARIPEVSAL